MKIINTLPMRKWLLLPVLGTLLFFVACNEDDVRYAKRLTGEYPLEILGDYRILEVPGETNAFDLSILPVEDSDKIQVIANSEGKNTTVFEGWVVRHKDRYFFQRKASDGRGYLQHPVQIKENKFIGLATAVQSGSVGSDSVLLSKLMDYEMLESEEPKYLVHDSEETVYQALVDHFDPDDALSFERKSRVTQIPEGAGQSDIRVFPTTIDREITLEGLPTNGWTVRLVDLSGRLSAVQNGWGERYRWDLPELAAGSYLGTVFDEKGHSIKTFKLVKP